MIFSSKRDILPGEELTISYIDVKGKLFIERQRKLKSFDFDCKCEKCLTKSKT
jgi:hypothetical protein